jgi:hypothetical protein
VSPRLGPWAELAAVVVVGGAGAGGSGSGSAGGGGGGGAAAAPRPLPPPAPPVLYDGARPAGAYRRAAAPCASALAYSRLVSRGGSSGGLLLAAAEAARKQRRRWPSLSASPPPPSASPSAALSAPAPAPSSPVPGPPLSALAPKTPPLPGSSEEEEEEEGEEGEEAGGGSPGGGGGGGERMSLDGENENEADEAEEIARKTEARRALSPGHPFSYPPLMLRFLYSRSRHGARRALEEAVEKVRARGKI